MAGEVSFGPIKHAATYVAADAEYTHAFVVPRELIGKAEQLLAQYPPDRAADVLAIVAVQHAFYDRSTGAAQSFGPDPRSYAGRLLDTMGALGDTGERFRHGQPVTRVEGVSTREVVRFLADTLAYTKHVEGKVGQTIHVNWERISGGNKGKTGEGLFSAQRSAASTPMTAKGRKAILDYINQVLGPSVLVEFPMLAHAGEFTTQAGHDIIRVSAMALNPMSVAYHESLHAFFKQLTTHGMQDVKDVLLKAASTPKVTAQLRQLLASEPAALAQLSDPEERLAYMYQFRAAGELDVGKAETLFEKIKQAIMHALGIWTNDYRAMHILDYFHSGEYAQKIGQPNVVHQALMKSGRNETIDSFNKMVKPLVDFGEKVVGAGAANLRDSGIPSLAMLANTIKKPLTAEGSDAGYLPAARLARTDFMNRYADMVGHMGEGDLHDALEHLQAGTQPPAGTNAANAVTRVRSLLDDLFDYLQKAGVDVKDAGVGKDYFPRRWDVGYLASHRQEFMDMARNYPAWSDPAGTFNALIAHDGSELQVVDRPGMSSAQRRVLDFLDDKDIAQFMTKDLHQIMSSYISQATRRAEWARRFGGKNEMVGTLLAQAKKEGATDKQIEQAQQFIAGVNGTLGDDLNPTARRLMGNMIVYQNIRLLPLAIFSSVVDPLGVLVRGGQVGQAWKTFVRGIKEIPMGLKGETGQDEMTRLARDLGTIDDAVLNHTLGALYTQGAVGETARKLNDTFFRFNLMEQFNTSMRVGATEAAMRFLERHGDFKATQHSERWMQELGLERGDVRMANGRLALSQAEGLTAAQEQRVRAAINQWVDGAVLRPDAADKPVWMNDPRFMLIAHLKQFVYSFHHTILSRVVHEYRHGNYLPAAVMASYVPVMIASDLAKGMLVGGGDVPEWKRNWTAADYVGEGIQRAGLLGVGQFGMDAFSGLRHGGTGIGSLMGPTIEQLGEAVDVMGGRKQFGAMALHSMPANQLMSPVLGSPLDTHFDHGTHGTDL